MGLRDERVLTPSDQRSIIKRRLRWQWRSPGTSNGYPHFRGVIDLQKTAAPVEENREDKSSALIHSILSLCSIDLTIDDLTVGLTVEYILNARSIDARTR
jgi:hypothetical protein